MGRITLRLPDELHLELQDLSQESGISLNGAIISALARTVGNREGGNQEPDTPAKVATQKTIQPRLAVVKLLQTLRELWLEREQQVETGRRSLAIDKEMLLRAEEEATALERVVARQGEVERLGGPVRTWDRIGVLPDSALDAAAVEKMLLRAVNATREADVELVAIEQRRPALRPPRKSPDTWL